MAQGGSQVGANAGGVVQQAVFFHDANGFHTGAHGQRVATKGGAVVAGLENIGGLWAGHHGANGHSRAQALGQRHDIRQDAGPLVRKPLAGAAHAALNLVNHQQPVALVTQGAHLAQVIHVRRVDATFTLDRLQKYRHHVGVTGGGRLQTGQVIERHADETFHQRAKASLHLGVAGGAEGGNGAAVEGFLVHHDLGPFNTLVMAELARHLERGLVRLQPGGTEKHIAHARQLNQFRSQRFLVGDMVVVGGVDQLGQLILQGWHQLGVVMAQCVDSNAAQSIQVLFAVDIPDAAALTVRQRDGHSVVGVHHMG